MSARPDSPLLLAAIFASFVVGCATSSLGRLGKDGELPRDLPKDYQDRFAIREVELPVPSPTPSVSPSPSPSPSPAPSPSPEPKGKRKGRKGRKGEPSPTPSPSPSPGPTDEVKTGVTYPNRRPAKDPIWLGEKATYDITYFGMAAGSFTLEALPYKTIDSRKVYHVKGNAVSSNVFNLFYRLNDSVESFIDYEGFFSHRFHLLLDETKQSRDALELYDSMKAQTYYWNRWNHKERGYSESKEFQPIPRFPQDSLSALYYLRAIPLPPNAVLTFPVVSEGKMWEAVISVIRRENCDTPLGLMRCVVVKPDTKFNGVLQKRGDSFIWLTDDDRRFVIRIEAKVKIGAVVGQIRSLQPGKPQ